MGNFSRSSDHGKWQCCQQLIFEEGDTTTERDVVGASSDSLDWVGCVDASHDVDMLLCYSKVRLILHGSLKQAVVAQSYIPHCILILLAPRHLKKFYRVQESHAPVLRNGNWTKHLSHSLLLIRTNARMGAPFREVSQSLCPSMVQLLTSRRRRLRAFILFAPSEDISRASELVSA